MKKTACHTHAAHSPSPALRRAVALFTCTFFVLALYTFAPSLRGQALSSRSASTANEPTAVSTEAELRAALSAGDEFISLAKSTNIQLESSFLMISAGKSVSIAGASGASISAGSAFPADLPLFKIASNATLTLNGSGSLGGGTGGSLRTASLVYNDGALIVDGWVLSGNGGSDVSPEKGGAIYSNGSLVIKGAAKIQNCHAGAGGGVYIAEDGALTLSGGTLVKNRADTGGSLYVGGTARVTGGSIEGFANSGGAIYIADTATLALSGNPAIGQESPAQGLFSALSTGIQVGSMSHRAVVYLESIPAAKAGTAFAVTQESADASPSDAVAFRYLAGGLKASVGGPASGFLLSGAGCRVRFNSAADKVNGMPAAHEQAAGLAYTIPSTPTRAGYTFAGWNTQSNGSGLAFSSDQSMNVYNDLTLYAQWAALPRASSASGTRYRILYDVNHGSIGTTQIDSQTGYLENENVTLHSTKPTRSDFKFTGWNTAANGTGTPYMPGATLSITSDTYLYAQWTTMSTSAAEDYSVRFSHRR